MTSASRTFRIGVAPGSVAPADHVIQSSTGTFDGAAVLPGEIVELAEGTRGPLKIKNLTGTAAKPIVVRAPRTGQVIIRKTAPAGTGQVFVLENCRHFILDGYRADLSGAAYRGCGIKIMYASQATPANQEETSGFLKFSATARINNVDTSSQPLNTDNAVIRYIHIDGGWNDDPAQSLAGNGIGIQTNHAVVLQSAHPGAFQENITIEHCWIQRTEGEGMYIGANPYDYMVPLKNIIIRHNRLEDTGWDAINNKSWWAGANSIHHNVIVRCGSASAFTNDAQLAGIASLSSQADIHHNWIQDVGHQGIICYTAPEGPFQTNNSSGYGDLPEFRSKIYDNVVIRAGRLIGTTNWGDGIVVNAAAASVPSGRALTLTRPEIFNNTVVDTAKRAISVERAEAGFVRNNIALLGPSGNINVGSGGTTERDNLTSGTPASIFADYPNDDYHLAAAQPVGSQSVLGTDVASDDIDGTVRSSVATADKGAYEK